MILNIFSIYDSKAEAYMQPFFMKTKGEAVRAFSDLVRDPQSMVSKHPEDYVLFEIGSFDDQKAEICVLDSPRSLGVAIEYVSV